MNHNDNNADNDDNDGNDLILVGKSWKDPPFFMGKSWKDPPFFMGKSWKDPPFFMGKSWKDPPFFMGKSWKDPPFFMGKSWKDPPFFMGKSWKDPPFFMGKSWKDPPFFMGKSSMFLVGFGMTARILLPFLATKAASLHLHLATRPTPCRCGSHWSSARKDHEWGMISQKLHFNMFQYISTYFNIFHKSSQNGCWTYRTSPLTLWQINPLRQDIGSRAGAGSMDLEVHSMREALSDSVGWSRFHPVPMKPPFFGWVTRCVDIVWLRRKPCDVLSAISRV